MLRFLLWLTSSDAAAEFMIITLMSKHWNEENKTSDSSNATNSNGEDLPLSYLFLSNDNNAKASMITNANSCNEWFLLLVKNKSDKHSDNNCNSIATLAWLDFAHYH